jgi:hypothetical protein
VTPSFARARAVADAVLFEGYVLYPYRASAPKNRLRWQFGVAAPRDWAETHGSDPWRLDTTCLVDGDVRLAGKLRFLQLRRRRVELAMPDGFQPVESLELGGHLHLPWDEADVREIDLELSGAEAVIPFSCPATREEEPLHDGTRLAARIVRESWAISGIVRITSERLTADEHSLHRVRIEIENTSASPDLEAPRDTALAAALLGTHVLLATDGRFLSLTDPPAWAEAAATASRQGGLYPVLVEENGRDVVLAAPFILYDHPRISPESPGDFYDATEIDELLTLRTLTLTDEEKRQVRATDARAAALLDRVEQMPPETMASLHGAVRNVRPRHPAGSRVRLRPGPRRTDAQDMFLEGMIATVEAVLHDVDGRECLAVSVDDDPARDLWRAHGRYHYFYPDEVESP